MKTGEAKSIPYPLPKTTVTGHFLFCTPRLGTKTGNPDSNRMRNGAMQRPFISTQGSDSRYRRSTPCRPSPTTPAQKSPKLKTFRNPIGKNHKFKINDLHKQYFSSNRYLCKRIKYIIYFSHAHRFGHCSQLLSCSLSRAAYRKYSATNVSGLRTDSARRLFDRRQP